MTQSLCEVSEFISVSTESTTTECSVLRHVEVALLGTLWADVPMVRITMNHEIDNFMVFFLSSSVLNLLLWLIVHIA